MQWHEDRVTRTVYSTDNSIYQVIPERVATPSSVAEIADALRLNAASDSPRPIVARGGGTGTNGQSLTAGLAIDLKRNLNRLLSIDTTQQTVTVEPGLVTAELNAALAEHGLFWPPHTSTLNRATVGGMISTDAAGKGSLVFGRAHRHVERLVVLLDDGTEWIAEPVTEAEAQRRADMGGRGGELWQALLDVELTDVDAHSLGLPELARGFSGYGLDRFRTNGVVNPIALVCGSEGTLGIIVQATLSLTPIAAATRLVVASYVTFDDALQDALVLRETGPIAIESFDETTLERGRSSPAWPALGQAVGDHQGAVLLLEYSGETLPDVSPALEQLAQSGRCRSHQLVDDPGAQKQIWKVRADAVGLLAKVAVGGPSLNARPTAFVEDCAVPVAAMPAFIAGFRRLLDDAGLTYGMFGHADVGCVHVRPALDLTSPAQRDLMAQVTDQVIELVSTHGGLVWGEHGRGFRGAHVTSMLPASTVALMRSIKTAFDPADIFNPGKLYRPLSVDTALIDVTDPPMRGEFDSHVAVELRGRYDHAFACNGNGLCHHYGADEVMCPSYKATGDPALSPKGRVDLLRSWLHGETDPEFEDKIAENLHQCLSCSACTGHCPVEVDIPELKSRFLHQYYENRRRPIRHALLGQFENLTRFAALAPAAAKFGLRFSKRGLGLVDLPVPGRAQRNVHDEFTGATGADVVVMPDVFTSSLDPTTQTQAIRVLESLGYSVQVSTFVASGKFDHVKGHRARFEKAAQRQAATVDKIVAAGAVPCVIEPAVGLLHHHEYAQVMASYPVGVVKTLAELLADRADRLSSNGGGASVRLLGHCTERATSPQTAGLWREILKTAGYVVDAPDVGCCGMAGIFGHEVENQTMSRRLWDLSWQAQVDAASKARQHVVATGYSCRSQAKRYGNEMPHPVTLLHQK